MDSVIGMESARRLVADSALWPQVRDFLWDFAPQIHPSRIPEGTGSLDAQSPRMRRYVLDKLGVAPLFHDFPADDNSRLALLPGETLGEIAKWLGALACAASLRRIMDGAKVRALKAGLPGIYPAVFSYTAYFRAMPDMEADSPEDVAAIGQGLFFGLFEGLPEPLVSRLKMKLPDDIAPRGGVPSVPRDQIALLLKLKFPEAHALCCS